MEYLIALGANLGDGLADRAEMLSTALHQLDDATTDVVDASPFYVTPAFPAGAGPDFVNAAARLRSPLAPADMLARLHAVEALMGRTRAVRWGARTLDLDLLGAQGQVLPDVDTVKHWMAQGFDCTPPPPPDELILPHPRLHERGFVLVPLADIAADWVHPITGQTVEAMLAALTPAQRGDVTLFTP